MVLLSACVPRETGADPERELAVGIESFAQQLPPELPALIIWGDADTVIPIELAERLVAALPGAERLTLAGASHPAYLKQPDAFHEALISFCGTLHERERSD